VCSNGTEISVAKPIIHQLKYNLLVGVVVAFMLCTEIYMDYYVKCNKDKIKNPTLIIYKIRVGFLI